MRKTILFLFVILCVTMSYAQNNSRLNVKGLKLVSNDTEALSCIPNLPWAKSRFISPKALKYWLSNTLIMANWFMMSR